MPHAYSYSFWDGSQHVLDLDAESLLEAMSDDLLEEGDLLRALQRLFRQGAQNQDGQRMPGLQDLLQQLRQKRQQQLQQKPQMQQQKQQQKQLHYYPLVIVCFVASTPRCTLVWFVIVSGDAVPAIHLSCSMVSDLLYFINRVVIN